MRSRQISLVERFKGVLALGAISALCAAGGLGHPDTAHANAAHAAGRVQLQGGSARGALDAVTGNLDETAREVAERRSRAEGRGGRDARGREHLRDADD